VRVDTENSLTSLTLQVPVFYSLQIIPDFLKDTGQVIAGSLAVVVKINSLPRLCKADEVGEICLYAPSTSSCYYGLKGLTQSVFSVSPLGPDDKQLGPLYDYSLHITINDPC
jgi:hypothetical protein